MNVIGTVSREKESTYMKTFTIDTDNNITVHASRKAAKETSLGVFATEEQFADLIGPDNKRLVEIWNSLPGVKPVTKFANRKMATERIWGAIQMLADTASAANETANAEPQETSAEQPVAAAEQSVVPPEEPIAETQPEAPVAPTPAEPLADAGEQAAEVVSEQPAATDGTTSAKKARKAKKATTEAAESDGTKTESTGPREGSKTTQVVAMLQREQGATLAEIMQTMGWQKHTVRGFMAGPMKKAGYTVESFNPEGGESSYRINL